MKTTATLLVMLLSARAQAQLAMTNVFTHWASGVTTAYTGTGATGLASSGFSTNTYTYQYGAVVASSNTQLLDSFATSPGNFHFQAATPVVKFRRVDNTTATGLRKSLWFQQNSATTINNNGTASLVPPYDQIVPNGVKATDVTKVGFAVYDRGIWVTNASYVVLPSWVDVFSARVENNEVWLNWQLGMTDNLKEVVVERSGDGTNFTPLINDRSPVAGAQAVFDAHPMAGSNFYRLKLLNNAGAVITYSSVCEVTTGGPSVVGVHVYANPVVNRRCILTAQGLQEEVYGLQIVDVGGRVVLHQSLMGAASFAMSVALPSETPVGIYILTLTDRMGKAVAVEKLVVL